jgi:hypothetical protein
VERDAVAGGEGDRPGRARPGDGAATLLRGRLRLRGRWLEPLQDVKTAAPTVAAGGPCRRATPWSAPGTSTSCVRAGGAARASAGVSAAE